jgi:hypothetical protein
MKVTKQTATEFEITDFPWFRAIPYVAILALFIGVTIEKYRANMPKEAAAVAVLVAFMALFFPSICAFTKLNLNRSMNQVVHSRFTLRGWHREERRLDDLAAVNAATDPNEKIQEDNPFLRMELTWKSGGVPLAMPIAYQRRAKDVSVGVVEQTVEAVQVWLYGRKTHNPHQNDDDDIDDHDADKESK